jgi:nucleoid-associated protein YgaU
VTVVVRSAAWLVLLVLGLLQLHDLQPDLAPAANGAPAGPDAAAVVVMALVRLVALGLGWYLVAATLLTLLVGVAGAARTTTRRLVPRTLHEGLRRVCGLTIAFTTAVPTLAAADERSAITMHRLADDPAIGDASAITMRRLEPPATVAPPSASDPAPKAVTPAPSSHVIDRGEHLWAVAESTLASAWGAPPTDREIDPFWRELVRRNRSRLPDPMNPDLVHPGLEIEVPPVPARDV